MNRTLGATCLVIGGGILIFACIIALVLFGWINSMNKQGVGMETALTSQYLDNQNELSTFIGKFYESLGIANLKSEKLEKVLTEAVKGRYDKEGIGGKAFAVAINEAYPDLSALNIYDKIIDIVSAGREGYKQKQSKLLDMLAAYDRWRNEDLIRKTVLPLVGFPGNTLRAKIGDSETVGEAALRQMYRIVLVEGTKEAYEKGVMGPLGVPTAAPKQ